MSATPPSRYPIPAATVRTELVIDRSRFLATVGPADSPKAARAFIEVVRAERPDATHHCWAYVAGPPGDTARIGMSDDGEPHGTAGRPILTALLHSGVGDLVAVVTRYYGGTKLGTGGLARAYAGAVNRALDDLPRTERVTWERVAVSVDYALVGAMQLVLAEFEVQLDDQVYAESVRYLVRVPDTRAAGFRAAVVELSSGRAVFEES